MASFGVYRPREADVEDENEEPFAKRSAIESSNDAIIESLTCPLCNGLFTSPVTLPQCSHVFCSKCVSLLETTPSARLIKCPMCFQTSKQTNLKENVKIKKAVKAIEDHKAHVQFVTTYSRNRSFEICLHLPSQSSGHEKCQHCGYNLCSICQPLHKKTVKEHILKEAEELLKDRDPKAGVKLLSIFKKSVEDAENEAKARLMAFLETLLPTLSDRLPETANKLFEKIATFSKECRNTYEPIIKDFYDEDKLNTLQEQLRQISNSDVDSINMEDVGKVAETLHDLKEVESSAPKPGLLFKFKEKQLTENAIQRCRETVEGLVFGTLCLTVKELLGKLTTEHCSQCKLQISNSKRIRRRSSRYEGVESGDDDDDDDDEVDSVTSGSEDNDKDESSAKKNDPPVVTNEAVPNEPPTRLPSVRVFPSLPVGPLVSFESKDLIRPRCLAALNQSHEGEFVALHGSNQLAVFNSKGFLCDLNVQSSDLASGLEMDAIYASNKWRRLYVTGTVADKRKIYLVTVMLSKPTNSACLYEIASSNDLRDFQTLLADEGTGRYSFSRNGDDEIFFTNSAYGELVAFYRTSGRSRFDRVEVGKLGGVGFRLLGVVKEANGWLVFFTDNVRLSSVAVTWSPQNFQAAAFQTFSCFGNNAFTTNDLANLQMFWISKTRPSYHDHSISLHHRAFFELPLNGAVVVRTAMISSLKLIPPPAFQLNFLPTKNVSLIGLATLSDKGILTMIMLPNK